MSPELAPDPTGKYNEFQNEKYDKKDHDIETPIETERNTPADEGLYNIFPESETGIIRDELEIGGKTVVEINQELEDKKIFPRWFADSILQSPDFTTSKKSEQIQTIRLKVRDLGFTDSQNLPTTDELYAKAQKLGLKLCPAEVGPYQRLKDMDRLKENHCSIAMRPVVSGDGQFAIFILTHDGYGKYVLAGQRLDPSSTWELDDEFMFRLPSVDEINKPNKQAEVLVDAEIEKETLKKVVDLGKETEIGVTTLGFGGIWSTPDAFFLGGLFNTERVLEMGLLPKSLLQRTSVPASKYGYSEVMPSQLAALSEEKQVYAFQLNKQAEEDKKEKWDFSRITSRLNEALYRQEIIKKWFLLFDLNNTEFETNHITGMRITGANGVSEYGIKIPGRVRPGKMKGVIIDGNLPDLNLQEYFQDFFIQEPDESTYGEYGDRNIFSEKQVENIKSFANQLKDIMEMLDIHPSDEQEERLKGITERLSEIDEKRKFISAHPEKTFEDGWRESDIKPLQNYERNYYKEIVEIYISVLSKHERLSNYATVGDYLMELGAKYKIPIYTLIKKEDSEDRSYYDDKYSTGLFYPRRMNPEQLKEFLSQQEKDKSEEEIT